MGVGTGLDGGEITSAVLFDYVCRRLRRGMEQEKGQENCRGGRLTALK